jgi:hypothetical protein
MAIWYIVLAFVHYSHFGILFKKNLATRFCARKKRSPKKLSTFRKQIRLNFSDLECLLLNLDKNREEKMIQCLNLPVTRIVYFVYMNVDSVEVRVMPIVSSSEAGSEDVLSARHRMTL